jgi:hypothetical protein
MNVGKTNMMKISRQPSPIHIISKTYLGSMITNDATCTGEIKSWIAMAKATINNKKALFTSKLNLNLKMKLVNCYICSTALYDVGE